MSMSVLHLINMSISVLHFNMCMSVLHLINMCMSVLHFNICTSVFDFTLHLFSFIILMCVCII